MPRQSAKTPSKTLYHGELKGMGPVRVKVLSDVLDSKYANKPPYVVLEIGGEERTYNTENDGCADFFEGQKGRVFTIVAEGSREEATITYVGEAAETAGQQPAPRNQRRASAPPPLPPAQAAAPPARQASRPPPAPATQNGHGAVVHAKRMVGQRLSLMKICLKASCYLRDEFQAVMGQPMPPEMLQAINSSLFISAERAGLASDMPPSIALGTLEANAPKKQAAPAQPPAEPPPPPAPEPEPAEPEDNVPF